MRLESLSKNRNIKTEYLDNPNKHNRLILDVLLDEGISHRRFHPKQLTTIEDHFDQPVFIDKVSCHIQLDWIVEDALKPHNGFFTHNGTMNQRIFSVSRNGDYQFFHFMGELFDHSKDIRSQLEIYLENLFDTGIGCVPIGKRYYRDDQYLKQADPKQYQHDCSKSLKKLWITNVKINVFEVGFPLGDKEPQKYMRDSSKGIWQNNGVYSSDYSRWVNKNGNMYRKKSEGIIYTTKIGQTKFEFRRYKHRVKEIPFSDLDGDVIDIALKFSDDIQSCAERMELKSNIISHLYCNESFIIRLLENKLTVGEVAKKLNIRKQRVSDIRKLYGLDI